MNKILVLVGPSGSGKTTIANKLLESGIFEKVKTYTTREKRRPNDNEYNFISLDSFKKMKGNGEFIDSIELYGTNYGFKYDDINNSLKYKNVILILDGRGLKSIKDNFPDDIIESFFIDSSGYENTRKNLLKRNTETDEDLLKREENYKNEILSKSLCKHSVVNLIIDESSDEILRIFLGDEGR